jgi:SAM-dependent methyltransferase
MRLLEVGCSSGFMLDVFKQNGLEIVGIEPSGGFLNFLRSKGYKVYESWEDFRSSEAAPFDVIAHFFVLEHIREPVEFLRSQLEVLKAGGRIIFEVPCVNDPLVTLYKVPAFDRFYWSIAHHWYFSSRSLSFILNKLNCRFKLIPEQRYDLSNHIVWMLEGKPGGQGRFSSIFSDELIARYNEDLKQHWICDTIFCVLEKP